MMRPLALALLLLAWASVAHGGETSSRAQRLFDQAQELRSQGRYDEACPKLRESQSLEPAVGTLLYLADCYEQIGRTGTAYETFIEAERAAKRVGDDREAVAHKSALALEPRLHRLDIRGGGDVSLDGKSLSERARARPVPVDPGIHTIEAHYQDRDAIVKTVEVIEPGKTLVVELPRDEPVEAAAPAALPPPATPEPASGDEGLGAQRIAAIPIGVMGVIGLVAGTALAVVAKNTYDDTACTEDDRCTQEDLDKRQEAISLANGATAAFVIGGALVALGIVLWFTAPDETGGVASSGPGFGAGLRGGW